MNTRRIVAAVTTVAAGALLMAGCSGTASNDTSADAGSGPVELEYMSWAPDLETPIAKWNEENPDIQVKFTRMPGGSDTNVKISSSVAAGNAPCMAQVNYTEVASHASNGYLMDVTKEAAASKDKFIPWTWDQVTLGGVTYGIPQDSGPVVTYYRSDVYDKLGLKPAATWDEYVSNAKAIHDADPSMYGAFLGTNDPSMVGTYAAQNGAAWTSIDGDSWVVDINGPESQDVADMWQGMVDDGTAITAPRYDPSFFKLLSDSTLVNYVGASWNVGLIEANVADQSGLWSVAPMPMQGSSDATANNGGSMIGILKGCEHPAEAIEFATWLNTSEEAWSTMGSSKGSGLYPAATDALDYGVFTEPSDFYGGQVVADEFAESASHVLANWTWGPAATDTNTFLGDGLADVSEGRATLPDVLDGAQDFTLTSMTDRGISATAG